MPLGFLCITHRTRVGDGLAWAEYSADGQVWGPLVVRSVVPH